MSEAREQLKICEVCCTRPAIALNDDDSQERCAICRSEATTDPDRSLGSRTFHDAIKERDQ